MKMLKISLLIILLFCASFAQESKNVTADNWVDYASVDYGMRPNITYSKAGNVDLKLDLYLPNKRDKALPTLVLFHGGGWIGGQKEANIFYLLPYLSMGWAVVNVEYRVANQSLAPGAVEDCRCALRWVYRNAEEFKFDTSKIVLTGTSAGGHLSLITGMLPAKNPFDRQCPTGDDKRWTTGDEPEMKVAAIVNLFGITDVADLLEGKNAKHYAIEWFGSMDNRMNLAKQVSPINYVRADLPPIITIHGENDIVVPYQQAVDLHRALDKVGAKNQLVTVKGGGHGGFNREQMVSNYAAVRKFLRENKVLE
jgi:acetyl esterase/lipase